MDRSLFTANFKRDYVAASAVAIFFLIVIAELALAVSIPAYFVKSNLWAENIRRQELFKDFDGLRNACNRAKLRKYEAEEENKIIFWTLNMMANYLRTEKNNLTGEQADALLAELNSMRLIAGRIHQGHSFNSELAVNTATAEKLLAQKLSTRAENKE